MDQPKVFEFAKELGMETMALMGKIREWGLPVKSHMVVLEGDMLEEIKTRLTDETAKKSTKKKAKKKKKAVAKKTAAKKTATTKKATTKKAATKKAVTKKAVTKKASGKVTSSVVKKAGSKVEKVEATVDVAPVKKTVIRRKKADIEAAETAAVEESKELSAVAATTMEENTVAKAAEAPTTVEKTSSEVVEAKTATPIEGTSAEARTTSKDSESETVAVAEEKSPAKVVARKVAVNVAEGETSGVKSIRTPKNIVGKMDLGRLAPKTRGEGNRGGDRNTSGSDEVRTPRTGVRNIRPGFVAAPGPVVVDPVEERKKLEDKQRPKKAGAGGKEIPVASFSSTEFRKREMVFQPKKKKNLLGREAMKTEITTPKSSKRVVRVNNVISVADFAEQVGLKSGKLMRVLMQNGVTATMNSDLDFDTVSLIAPELGWEAVNTYQTVEEKLETIAFGDLEAEGVLRAPVVTVMGHVDHGKTTLLDSIRSANVVTGEAGGITQHIAAYSVHLPGDKVVTFVDTPGHEAFTAMRARGANVTDIAVIVVAADDGVMPQTKEAISHAKAAEVPIVVAVNKIDKPEANIEKIKQQMTEHELVPEEWGGDTMFIEVSALKGTGITNLLEQLHLIAEMAELKANPKQSGTGVVIESCMVKGRGIVGTLLVKDGTIKVGDSIVAGKVSGKIRSLINDQGKVIKEAGPSMPVEVLGLPETPLAGDRFDICQSDDQAQEIAMARKSEEKLEETPNAKMSLDDLFSKVKAGSVKELPIVLKTDVAGSFEAIKGMFDKLATDEVKVKIIHSAVGGISESDVLLASAAEGIVFGFNTKADSNSSMVAKNKGVEIKTYKVIYELVDDIKKAMSGLLDPEIVEKAEGKAEVRDIFNVPKLGTIAGCFVTEGKITRTHLLRLNRGGKIIHEGKVTSLKRFKDDVKEVKQSYECGIGIEKYTDLQVGDVIEAYVEESIAREL